MEHTQSNIERFITNQERYFSGSYEQFLAFGGPSVYFHVECLRAGQTDFLSKRHIEMLYATLAAWGMHRMGDLETTKTKLTNWERFYGSLVARALGACRRNGHGSQFMLIWPHYGKDIQILRPKTKLLLPPSLLDWLPEGHLAHFILDVVEQLDLSKIYASYEGDGRGQPPYDPRMMTALLFYALLHRRSQFPPDREENL